MRHSTRSLGLLLLLVPFLLCSFVDDKPANRPAQAGKRASAKKPESETSSGAPTSQNGRGMASIGRRDLTAFGGLAVEKEDAVGKEDGIQSGDGRGQDSFGDRKLESFGRRPLTSFGRRPLSTFGNLPDVSSSARQPSACDCGNCDLCTFGAGRVARLGGTTLWISDDPTDDQPTPGSVKFSGGVDGEEPLSAADHGLARVAHATRHTAQRSPVASRHVADAGAVGVRRTNRLLERARRSMRDQDYTHARRLLQGTDAESSVPCRFTLALCSLALGEPQPAGRESRDVLAACLSDAERCAETRAELAGIWSDAAPALRALVPLSFDDPDATYLRAVLSWVEGDTQAAARELQILRDRYPHQEGLFLLERALASGRSAEDASRAPQLPSAPPPRYELSRVPGS